MHSDSLFGNCARAYFGVGGSSAGSFRSPGTNQVCANLDHAPTVMIPEPDDAADLDALEELYLGGRQHAHAEAALGAAEPPPLNKEDELNQDNLPSILAAAKDLGISVMQPSHDFDDLLAEAESFYADMDRQTVPADRDLLREFVARPARPAQAALPQLEVSDPRQRALSERQARFESARLLAFAAAPRRILRGFAVLVIGGSGADSSALHAQYDLDSERLSRGLYRLGFSEVQLLRGATRPQLLTYLDSLCFALRRGGNLDVHDGLLVYLGSSGGTLSLDCAPCQDTVGQPSSFLQDKPLHLQELLSRLRNSLEGRPKIVVGHICCDPAERSRVNVECSNISRPVPAVFEDLLEELPDTMILWCSTAGPVNWVPRGGSLVVNFLLDCLKKFCHDLDLDSIVSIVVEKMKAHFIHRRGLGTADCAIGRKAYEDFFVQKPIIFKHRSMQLIGFGPALVFCKEHTDPRFDLSMTDSCVSKQGSSPDSQAAYVNSFAQLPATFASTERNVAWEFLILNLQNIDDLVLGFVPKLISTANNSMNSSTQISNNTPPSQGRRTRRNSISFDNEESDSRHRPGVDFGWGISASGILYPGERVHYHCFGTGDRVECWIDKIKKTVEFTVNGDHAGHLFCEYIPTEIFPVVVSACYFFIVVDCLA